MINRADAELLMYKFETGISVIICFESNAEMRRVCGGVLGFLFNSILSIVKYFGFKKIHFSFSQLA